MWNTHASGPINKCFFLELSHVSKPVKLFHQARLQGIGYLAKKTFRKLKIAGTPKVNNRTYPQEVLDLKAGDWVQVKPREEIQQSLNPDQRFKGLYFMPAMWKFCGKQFRVYKKLNAMMIESTGQLIKMKNTVLLEGVHCDGEAYACDASCFHFWREIWLQKIEKPTRQADTVGNEIIPGLNRKAAPPSAN